MLQFEVVRTHQ